MDDLPTDYDTIVVGTGMPECILAAAHARNGRHVLHLDRNDHYGGAWASFNFIALESYIEETNKEIESLWEETKTSSDFQEFLKEGESATLCHHRKDAFWGATVKSNLPEKIEIEKPLEEKTGSLESDGVGVKVEDQKDGNEEKSEQDTSATTSKSDINEETWSLEKLKTHYRKFNLDLAPKLLFSRGELVDLLISSNIARYAEFKAVTRVLTYLDGKLELVPCSRADVFSTKNVSVVEKRMLMKLLTFCLNYEKNREEYEGFEDKTFMDYLKSRKLTDNVLHYVMYAIAMVNEDAKTLEGLEATRRFLNSLGRFGNTPFLSPLYGSGELPQCFCRLCAVYGGIYYLKRDVEAVIVESESGLCTGIVSAGKRINCKWLVMESNYAPLVFLSKEQTPKRISKGIVITDKSVLPAEKEQITLLRLPKGDRLPSTVTVLELGPGAMVCPPGLFVVYLSVQQSESAEIDLLPAMEVLFGSHRHNDASLVTESNKPNVLWSLFFCQEDNFDACNHTTTPTNDRPKNVILTSSPSNSVDFDDTIIQARNSFKSIFPDEEFLPRAPDPEDIVIEDVAEENPGHPTSESDVRDQEVSSQKPGENVILVEEEVVKQSTEDPTIDATVEELLESQEKSSIPEILVSSPEKSKFTAKVEEDSS